MKQRKRSYNICILSAAFALAAVFGIFRPLAAAELSLTTKTPSVRAGQTFEVGVFLDSAGEDINALEGKIIFPDQSLAALKINEGNSIINFWTQAPAVAPGAVSFAGIVPGGYNGPQGLVMVITFLSKEEGRAPLEFSDIQALLNDGAGTAARLSSRVLSISVAADAPVPYVPAVQAEDVLPPEDFSVQIAADPDVFAGRWFLVFAAQDKGSGIDHYEVKEGRRDFVMATSPHLLTRQALNEEIAVKAVDKSGNERVVVTPPARPAAWYEKNIIWAIIILSALIAGSIWLWRRPRLKR